METLDMSVQFAPTKSSDKVSLHICRQMVRGAMNAGDILPTEQELATEFNVSKLVIRESLKALSSLGLVKIQQGKRTVVQAKMEWDILDPMLQNALELEGLSAPLTAQLQELRLILESASATKAAERASQLQIETLLHIVAELKEIAAVSRDRDDFLSSHKKFHDSIAQASGNEPLRQVLRNVHQYLHRDWDDNTLTKDEMALSAEMHGEIADAIFHGDGARAAESIARHIPLVEAKNAKRLRKPSVR